MKSAARITCTIPTTTARSAPTMSRNVWCSATCTRSRSARDASSSRTGWRRNHRELAGERRHRAAARAALLIAAPDNTGLADFALNVGRGDRLKDPVLPSDQRTTDRWFDTTAFAAAAPFTIPNDSLIQPRLRDPNRVNFDMSFIRNHADVSLRP